MNATQSTSREPRKRIYAPVDSETHQEAKIAAINAGMDLQDWAAAAIREKLEREKRSDFSVVHSEE